MLPDLDLDLCFYLFAGNTVIDFKSWLNTSYCYCFALQPKDATYICAGTAGMCRNCLYTTFYNNNLCLSINARQSLTGAYRSWGLGLGSLKYVGGVRVCPPKMSHSFIKNCCWITLQVLWRMKDCVKNGR